MGQDSFTPQKRPSVGGVLPTNNNAAAGGGRARLLAGMPRGRQIHKTFNNIKITILCGFVTILVLRGTIGVGNLGSSEAEAVNQNLIEETNRILAEIRSDSDPNDPDEPLEAENNPNVTYTLGPKISDWDQQRKVWLSKNPEFPSFVNGKARILLVTGSPPNPCDNAIGDHYLLKSIKNKIDYCRLHGIEIVYNMAHLDRELAGYWAKLPLIRRLMLSHPEVEWIWWMDSDAFFTDMVFEIPLSKYDKYNLVVHGYPDLMFEQKSWIALNTGSFLFRNCQWSLDLLDAWAPMGPKGPIREEAGKILTANLKGRPAFEADDQSALRSVPAKQASPKDWINMINEFQRGALATRLGIPMIYGIDAVHGHNNVYNATIFPHNIGLGATRDPELLKRIGAATALEVRATGIQYAFAPCIAVCRDPRWGRCYESYSEDPTVVQAMTEIIPGLQGDIPRNSPKAVPFVAGKTKVAACAKHYAGDSGTIRGINENNTVINWNGLFSIHMSGYYNSIMKGVSTIMVSYSSLNGVKMHANHDMITNFLKKTLRFKGFVISDWLGIDKITSPPHANYTYSIEASINAGLDMVMVPYNYTEFIDGLTYLVKNKFIPMRRINDAVKRILRVKFVMGLFENPLADESLVDQLGSKEHRELAREAVRKSLVLLKNGESADAPLLPLPKKAPKILVAGSHADNLGYQCGGWTIEWQGLSGNNLTTGTTILTAIKNTVDPSTEVVYNENPDAEFVKSNNFSYAIVVVGEYPYAETQGDSSNLTITEPGPSTITNVCGTIKCVVIVVSGRPVMIQPYLDSIDSLVAAWLPGSEGQGVADVLFGDYDFTGKLSFTWFKTVDQLPMHVGDPHYDPLFPLGFGLTTKPTHT